MLVWTNAQQGVGTFSEDLRHFINAYQSYANLNCYHVIMVHMGGGHYRGH